MTRPRQVRCVTCDWKASGPFFVLDGLFYCEECAEDVDVSALSQESADPGAASDA